MKNSLMHLYYHCHYRIHHPNMNLVMLWMACGLVAFGVAMYRKGSLKVGDLIGLLPLCLVTGPLCLVASLHAACGQKVLWQKSE